jgi:hypothetical protein
MVLRHKENDAYKIKRESTRILFLFKEEIIMKKAILLSFMLLAACNGADNTIKMGYAYGLTHGHYAGYVEITTNGNNVITDVNFEEYFMPYNWAKVSADTATANPEITVFVDGSRSDSYYAKHITVGDKNFTAFVVGEAGSQSVVFSSSSAIDNIDDWIESDENARWYINAIREGDYGFADASFEPVDMETSDTYAKVAMTKSESGYWAVQAPGLGWSGNMEAIKDLLVGSTFDFESGEFTKNGEGFWSNGNTVTGATLNDFSDYIDLAARAYASRSIMNP